MKNLKKLCSIVLLVVMGFVGTSFAQTATTRTTLSAAITSTTTNVITVASNTGFTADTTAIMIDSEYMPVRAVSGTSITVRRGQSGTLAATHANNQLVYVGPIDRGPFINQTKTGSCTSANETYLPQIVVSTGDVITCNSSSLWMTTLFRPYSVSLNRTVSTSGNYTVLLTDHVVALTSDITGRTVTLPSVTGINGKVVIIKHEVGLSTNMVITIATTNGQLIDGSAGGVSTITSTTTGQVMRFYSGGNNWFTW